MAFNQGPEPEIVLNENGIRYIDPNPTNEIVNHEDLVMYVKLIARTKGRSVLTVDGDETTTVVEQRNVKSVTNFTYPTGDQYLDTRWTNIGGGSLALGEDVGAFGITNINIEFKSSFMPQIVIDFVDVRGATLFEQGPCSPYASFFHLPYPVFELTVKGYYGKPVTYTLALVKFNTKFNADTGNFESRAEFVGYTYAFLADIPMGYVLAATYMKYPLVGKEVLAGKWAQLISRPGLSGGDNGLPGEPLTMFDLIKNAKKLETELPRLKNDTEVKNLTKLNATKTQLTGLKELVEEYKKEYLRDVGNNTTAGLRETNSNRNTIFLKVAKTTDLTDPKTLLGKAETINTKYFGTDSAESFKSSLFGSKYDLVKSYYSANSLEGCPDLNIDKIRNNSSGFFKTAVKDSTADPQDYYVDLYEGVLKDINTALTSMETQYKEKKEEVRKRLNDEVRTILGFFPNIRNVFAIILTNVEVFLELLLQTSIEAEKFHDSEDIQSGLGSEGTQQILDLKDKINAGAEVSDENKEKLKVYPWPTYYEKIGVESTSGDAGSKEKFPGDNINFTTWPEVLFVEDFIKALTELAQDIAVLDLEVENLPGFDNFAPITPYETQAFGEEKAPNRWYSISSGTDKLSYDQNLFKVMGENAFILGDYTMINTLTLWKSQLGFTNGWGFQTYDNLSVNGYLSTNNNINIDTTTQEPYTLRFNPLVDETQTNLGRYNGDGMPLYSQTSDRNFQTKISPATKKKMEDWGYVDALNCMSTLAGEGEVVLLNLIKTTFEGGNVDSIKPKIISALKAEYGDEKFLVQGFDTWKKSAVAAIGVTDGSTALIDKQNLWNSDFNYVKSSNVLTLNGPIKLNASTQITETLLSANPHRNYYGGARLVKSDEATITSRTIDFNKEKLGSKIWEEYKRTYAYGISETATNDQAPTNTEQPVEEEDPAQVSVEVDTGTIQAKKSAISYTSLKNRPKLYEKGISPYSYNSLVNEDKQMSVDKNLGILNLGVEFYPNFYYTIADTGEDFVVQGKEIWDIASSRTIRGTTNNLNSGYEWADFVGTWMNSNGTADPIIQTPLWTVNYPLYKNPFYYSDGMVGNKEGDQFELHPDRSFTYAQKNGESQKRNRGTWWGLNQWGIDNRDDIYLPLAYLAVMSLGFDNANTSFRSGHFPPFDGYSFTELSSFANFGNIALSATLPKAYILLIGAILWRMKESNLLLWDDIKRSKPNPSDGVTPGWNSYGKSVGIDDLGDPVWFFHNSTSRPWSKGGCVFDEIIEGNTTDDKWSFGYYRRWIGRDSGDIDRWTTDSYPYRVRIGTETPITETGTISDSSLKGSGKGWVKSHTRVREDDNSTVFGTSLRYNRNINKGLFDQCRPDQMPFLFSVDTDYKLPKTLIITDFSTSIRDVVKSNGDTISAPNRPFKNRYLKIKERAKELMFIPKTLKEEFIEVFVSWAKNEKFSEGGWLSTMDALNFDASTGIQKFVPYTPASNNYNDQYKANGSLGLVNETFRGETVKLGNLAGDNEKNFWLTCYSVSNKIGLLGTPSGTLLSNDGYPNSDRGDTGACFITGTKIKLSNGKNKNIEDLLPTDKIFSFDLTNNKIEESTIDGINITYSDDIITIVLENGIKINCTSTHPFYVKDKGFVAYRINNLLTKKGTIKNMVIGDKIFYQENNKFIEVAISKVVQNKTNVRPVYDIKGISGNKTYIANNVLVHSTFN